MAVPCQTQMQDAQKSSLRTYIVTFMTPTSQHFPRTAAGKYVDTIKGAYPYNNYCPTPYIQGVAIGEFWFSGQ